ncbi:cation-translocating P-type ATPase [Oceanirhabdus sp. W0125-5]|uniref:cation-translocating P-type ATPase n=1 Tax=Oceanirhabdus sp. W0125-5 TaxID=2999116 RepID=UPI0022F32A41|nr:cation-translocating P-type ATPase [Oceanirhabdus sp. W0125-5]WBW98726.1 cation-translocating P-type ATPase [Oceanirhabdus sp. W0125-5]
MWFNKDITEVTKELNSDIVNGLSTDEVKKRLEEHGYNKLKEKKKKSILRMFFEQVNDVMIYILFGAAIVSGILGELTDSIIIGIVILVNAVIGVVQENKAEKSLEALKKLSTPKALVKRDGTLKEISSEEVVPGDIIVIDAGRYIPCDMRIIESANLMIEESALTGESVPVEKNDKIISDNDKIPLGDQKNMAFSSTLATYGRGVGIAVGTGMDTEIGKIAKLLHEEVDTKTPLQKKLDHVGKLLGFLALGVCALIFVVGLLQGREVFDMFMISISLAVAAIPEGLVAVVTIVLAMGVQKMIKENAIIRKLPAVETLGSVSIICSDKTGTLTQNKMTVTKFYCDNKFGSLDELSKENPTNSLLLENIVLNNDATFDKDNSTGDPTEIALLEAGFRYNIFKDEIEKTHKRVDEIPFDSDRKLMTTVNEYNGEYYVMTKGALDNLLNLCNKILIDNTPIEFTDELKQEVLSKSYDMSDEALRVIASAYKIIPNKDINISDLEKDLTFIGMVGMIDPPREEVKDSIKTCKESGIRTVMITGDHKNTAFAIAQALGIASSIDETMDGVTLDSLSQEELNSKIDSLRVFARVSPEHKVKIVKALKSKGNIVSMTGDGVNDAPSLRMADIGVAMGITGTDVSKDASDMILTDDNFSTIVRAVEEGRNIYNNIKKTIAFLLSCNIGEIIALFLAIIMGWFAPLIPIHILWVNLVTDTLPALALGVDPGDKDVMKDKPRNPKESLFKGTGPFIFLNGFIIGILTLIAFMIGIKHTMGISGIFPLMPEDITEEALTVGRTMAFVVLSMSQLVHSFNLRNSKKSIFQVGLFTNKFLIISMLIGLALQLIVISVPPIAAIFKVKFLTGTLLITVIILSLVPLIVNEIIKIFKRRISK